MNSHKTNVRPNLAYLDTYPSKLYWKIIAGPPGAKLSSLQEYDLIYDKTDLKIRKMDTPENLEHLRKVKEIREKRNAL